MSIRRRLVLLLPPSGGGAGPTTASLSGPSTGATGAASSNFTVTLDAAATSTVTVSPAGTNGTVTFTPSSPTIGVGQTTVTFTASAALDGLHAISIATSPTLTISGSPVNYTTNTPVGFDLNDSDYVFEDNTGTPVASSALTFFVHDVTTGALVALITGYSTNASGIVTSKVVHASLVAHTLYSINIDGPSGTAYGRIKLTAA